MFEYQTISERPLSEYARLTQSLKNHRDEVPHEIAIADLEKHVCSVLIFTVSPERDLIEYVTLVANVIAQNVSGTVKKLFRSSVDLTGKPTEEARERVRRYLDSALQIEKSIEKFLMLWRRSIENKEVSYMDFGYSNQHELETAIHRVEQALKVLCRATDQNPY